MGGGRARTRRTLSFASLGGATLDNVLAYTNAATILTEEYADTEDLDGVFSGLNREHRYYAFDTWRYQGRT